MNKEELTTLIEKHIAETIRLNALIKEFNESQRENEIKVESIPNPLQYPDFASWKENGISARKAPIMFAPEDYYEYDKNGKKKTKFTLSEALTIEETVLKPHGWRLTTAADWRTVYCEFTRGGYGSFLDEFSINPDGDRGAPVLTCNGEKIGKYARYWMTSKRKNLKNGYCVTLPGEKLRANALKEGSLELTYWMRMETSQLVSPTEKLSIRCVFIDNSSDQENSQTMRTIKKEKKAKPAKQEFDDDFNLDDDDLIPDDDDFSLDDDDDLTITEEELSHFEVPNFD